MSSSGARTCRSERRRGEGSMRGWKLISDRAVYAEVALTQLGQEITIGRGDCGIVIPKEHTCVSRTHAVIKVEPTEPWRVVVIDTSKRGVHVDGQRVEMDPASGLRKRQLRLGQTISLSRTNKAVPSFTVRPATVIGRGPAEIQPAAHTALAATVLLQPPAFATAATPTAVAPADQAAEQAPRASTNSGFQHMHSIEQSNPYRAVLRRNGADLFPAHIPTPKEAAMCVARWLRDHPATDEGALAAAASASAAAQVAAAETVAEAVPSSLFSSAGRVQAVIQPAALTALADTALLLPPALATAAATPTYLQKAQAVAPVVAAAPPVSATVDASAARRRLAAAWEASAEQHQSNRLLQRPMTAAEAATAAATEGLTLERADTLLGFRYVYAYDNKYHATVFHNGERHYLGSFKTPEEAALWVARWLRDRASTDEAVTSPTASGRAVLHAEPAESAGEAAAPPPHPMPAAAEAVVAVSAGALKEAASLEASAERHRMRRSAQAPMAAEVAVAAAVAEGLTLVRSNNASGFRNVTYQKRTNKHKAQLYYNGELHSLGFFHTAEEAALYVARWLRDHAPADQAALASAASVHGAEAPSATPATAEEEAPRFAQSLNGTLTDWAVGRVSAVRLHLAGHAPLRLTGSKRAREPGASRHPPYLASELAAGSGDAEDLGEMVEVECEADEGEWSDVEIGVESKVEADMDFVEAEIAMEAGTGAEVDAEVETEVKAEVKAWVGAEGAMHVNEVAARQHTSAMMAGPFPTAGPLAPAPVDALEAPFRRVDVLLERLIDVMGL